MKPKFKVGDKVTMINDYGVKFPNKTITEVIEKWLGCSGSRAWDENAYKTLGAKYKYEPTDTPWYSVTEEHLRLEGGVL